MYNGPKWVGYDSPERAKTKVSFRAGVLKKLIRTSYNHLWCKCVLGATTLSIKTLNITTFSIRTLSITFK